MFNPGAYYEKDNFGLTPKDYNNPVPKNAEPPLVQHQNGVSKNLNEATKMHYRAEYVFSELMNCNCCERHKKDKPTLNHFDEKSWKDCQHWNASRVGDIGKECECPCRHYMRFLASANLDYELMCHIVESSEEFISPPESPPKLVRRWAIQR